MAAWVWLCSFPAPRFRVRESTEEDLADAESWQRTVKRTRFGPSVARMFDREAGPPEFANVEDWCRTANSASDFTARSLLRVEPSHTWDGPLTPWSDEAALQRCFLGFPLDAYVAKVTHVFDLPAPQQLFTKLGRRGQEVVLQSRWDGMVFAPASLTMESLVFRDARFTDGHREAEPLGRTVTTAAALAAEFQEKLSEDPLGVLLAEPFVDQIMSRRAGDLVLLGHWSSLWPDFPPRRWAKATSGLREAAAVNRPVNPASLG